MNKSVPSGASSSCPHNLQPSQTLMVFGASQHPHLDCYGRCGVEYPTNCRHHPEFKGINDPCDFDELFGYRDE